jgi:hypothetical protein
MRIKKIYSVRSISNMENLWSFYEFDKFKYSVIQKFQKVGNTNTICRLATFKKQNIFLSNEQTKLNTSLHIHNVLQNLH